MEVKIILRKEELLTWFETLMSQKILAMDTETTGLDPRADRVRLLQIAAPGMPTLVIDCFSFLPEGAELLKELMAAPSVKIFHNAKFDLQFLMPHDIFVDKIFDTMLAAQLLKSSGGPERFSLKAVAWHYLEESVDKEEQTSNWGGELTRRQIEYAALDAEILLRLRSVLVEKIYENGLARVAEIEFHCARAVAFMEYHGIYLNMGKWRELTAQKEVERDAALKKMYKFTGPPAVQTTLWADEGKEEILGCDFDSSTYVVQMLNDNGVPVTGTSKLDLLPYRSHPLVAALSDYRKAAKALSSFLYPFPGMLERKTSRLHPNYGQISAWSGRMSCYNPNVQQIPRDAEFRGCFTARSGRKLLIADYSQIELRVAAQIARDRRMTEAYRNGEDLHLLTASLVQNKPMADVTKAERQAAKAVNFGLIFGMGAAGLQQYAELSYGVTMTLEEATAFRERYFKAYTGILKWHETVRAALPAEGRTLTGRKFLYDGNSGLPTYYNSPVQGTAADIMKYALGLMVRRIDLHDTYICAVIHDEIILEVPEEKSEETAALLKRTMEEAGNAILPDIPVVSEVVVSDSWADK